MWLNLSSLIGDMQTLQQCAGERYLISLIIIIPPDRSPPPDCCPSPNFPLYRVDTDQINCADARGSLRWEVGRLWKNKKLWDQWCQDWSEEEEWAMFWQVCGVMSTERQRRFELMRPGDGGGRKERKKKTEKKKGGRASLACSLLHRDLVRCLFK